MQVRPQVRLKLHKCVILFCTRPLPAIRAVGWVALLGFVRFCAFASVVAVGAVGFAFACAQRPLEFHPPPSAHRARRCNGVFWGRAAGRLCSPGFALAAVSRRTGESVAFLWVSIFTGGMLLIMSLLGLIYSFIMDLQKQKLMFVVDATELTDKNV